jgi:hypothetical protein
VNVMLLPAYPTVDTAECTLHIDSAPSHPRYLVAFPSNALAWICGLDCSPVASPEPEPESVLTA